MNRHLVFAVAITVWHFASMGRCPLRIVPPMLPPLLLPVTSSFQSGAIAPQ
jgi:hypothetical protein